MRRRLGKWNGELGLVLALVGLALLGRKMWIYWAVLVAHYQGGHLWNCSCIGAAFP